MGAVVLWSLGGFTVWIFAVLVAALVVVRLAQPLLPRVVQPYGVLLIPVTVFVFGWWWVDSWWARGVGVGVALVVVLLRAWRNWKALTVAAIVVAGMSVGYGIERHHRVGSELPSAHDREYNISTLRLREPRLFAQRLNSAVLVGDEWGVCFMFSDSARPKFTASIAGASSCEDAVRKMREQIRDPRKYEFPGWDSSALKVDGKTATFDLCQVYWGDVFSGVRHDVGPKFGRLTLSNPIGPGWVITDYEPCPAK
ncbi:hypothetical protein ACQPW3_38840 [Actinosynnema sp. CA-248983]